MVHHSVCSPISSIRGEKALTTSHRVLMCFIAASALVLSGCGSSNNTKPAAPAASPATLTACCEDERVVLTKAVEAYTTAKDAYDADPSSENATALKAAADAGKTAADAYAAAADDGTAAEQEAAQLAVGHADGAVAYAEEMVAAAVTAAAEAAAEAATTKALAIDKALMKPSTSGFDGGQLTIKHTEKDGMSVVVKTTGLNGVVGGGDDVDFAADGAPHAIRGWPGSKWMSGDESVSVYTNIQAPGRQSFVAAYIEGAAEFTLAADGFAVTDGVLTLAVGANTTVAKLVTLSQSLVGTSVILGVGILEDPVTLKGTFDGASGVFSCVAADCSVVVEDKKFAGFGQPWIFTAAPGATIDTLVTDADYLHFGYWKQATEDADGVVGYDFQSFSGGEQSFGMDNIGPLTDDDATYVRGTASYAGPAAGLYVRKSLMPDGSTASATSGSFTAHAKLGAHFGQNAKKTIAPANLYSIWGTVGNFRDGTTRLDGWTVELKRASFDGLDGAGGGAYTDTFKGETTGGGSWNGQFFGVSTEGSAGDDTATPVEPAVPASMPSSVAGEFDATFNNGQVNGAFGAVKQP